MPLDRPPWFRRRHAVVETEPSVVADEMEAATQRLRDQAWKINATTRPPLIPDDTIRAVVETADGERADR